VRKVIKLINRLSALDPGKQGLKHFMDELEENSLPGFQRLIQENKD